MKKTETCRLTRLYFLAAFLLLCASMLLNVCMGSANLTLAQVWEALTGGPSSGVSGRILWYARLPRLAACILAGMALSVSGAVIQCVLSNKLASPGIIGVNAGAGFAVTLCCALGALSGLMISAAAFAGATIAVLLVAFTAQKIGASRTTVIMGGVAVNSCLTAASEAISILVPDAGMQAADFRVGGFSAVSQVRLLPAGVMIVLGILVLLTLTNELDVISLGEDTAQGLGLPVRRMRTLFLGIAAMLAGAAVSFAGLLGFVGLIVPHIARRFVGGESRHLLPFCALTGACLLTGCDLIARTAFAPHEIPVGIFMSLIGGPFFLFLLLRRKGGHAHG